MIKQKLYINIFFVYLPSIMKKIKTNQGLCYKLNQLNYNQILKKNQSKIKERSDSPLESNHPSKETPSESALFRAVVMQALLDSVSQSKRSEDKIAKNQAIKWFDIKDKDFLMVCSLAGLNAKWVLEKSKKAISRGCKWRNVKGKKL